MALFKCHFFIAYTAFVSIHNAFIEFVESLILKQFKCFPFVISTIAYPDVVPAVRKEGINSWPVCYTNCWEAADSLFTSFRQSGRPWLKRVKLTCLMREGCFPATFQLAVFNEVVMLLHIMFKLSRFKRVTKKD